LSRILLIWIAVIAASAVAIVLTIIEVIAVAMVVGGIHLFPSYRLNWIY
jgi:hypothetical protein